MLLHPALYQSYYIDLFLASSGWGTGIPPELCMGRLIAYSRAMNMCLPVASIENESLNTIEPFAKLWVDERQSHLESIVGME